jgi:hypothetical protein
MPALSIVLLLPAAALAGHYQTRMYSDLNDARAVLLLVVSEGWTIARLAECGAALKTMQLNGSSLQTCVRCVLISFLCLAALDLAVSRFEVEFSE